MLQQFYEAYYKTVYGYLLSLCADPYLAEDLTSDTFLKAMEKIHSYDPQYSPTTWLCTIGKNLFYNHCKREKRHAPFEENIPVVLPSPEELYLKKEQTEDLKKAAEALSPLQRQVFSMRLQDLSFRQIGEALGQSEVWARVTFYRAKGLILSKLSKKEESL